MGIDTVSIESIGHPLAFPAEPGSLNLNALPSQDGVKRVRTMARTLAGMQKEAIIQNGPDGTVWRVVCDEGPWLNGTARRRHQWWSIQQTDPRGRTPSRGSTPLDRQQTDAEQTRREQAGPEGAVGTDGSVPDFEFMPDDEGLYVATLTITDSLDQSATSAPPETDVSGTP